MAGGGNYDAANCQYHRSNPLLWLALARSQPRQISQKQLKKSADQKNDLERENLTLRDSQPFRLLE